MRGVCFRLWAAVCSLSSPLHTYPRPVARAHTCESVFRCIWFGWDGGVEGVEQLYYRPEKPLISKCTRLKPCCRAHMPQVCFTCWDFDCLLVLCQNITKMNSMTLLEWFISFSSIDKWHVEAGVRQKVQDLASRESKHLLFRELQNIYICRFVPMVASQVK